MKQVYLIWAIVGAVVPFMFFLGLFHDIGLDVAGFIPALFATPAAGGFTADLLITSFVFWTYMFTSKDGPKPWLFVVLNLCIGLSCALPAYLYRRVAMQEAAA